MPYAEQMLAQVRLSTANDTLLYTPPKHMIVCVTYMIICNDSGGGANLSLYHHNAGSSSNANTIIMSVVPFAGNTFHDLTSHIILNTVAGNVSQLRALAGTADAFNLTVYGHEIK